MGSGTVLFEALRMGRTSRGTEINPGALIFARIAEIAALNKPVRLKLMRAAQSHVARVVESMHGEDVVGAGQMLDGTEHFPDDLKMILEATFVMAARNKTAPTGLELSRTFRNIRASIETFPETLGLASAQIGDARYLPFDDDSCDLIITSPPYINVFNYHQQFRQAVEALGYAPLRIATSEIGSNRKHRQNRFLTVVQYCLDMSMAIREMSRTLRPGGGIVLVVGRESRVRGTAFDNGALIASLLLIQQTLTVKSRSERKFVTRFGELIYEDILFVTRKKRDLEMLSLEVPRLIGLHALGLARSDDSAVAADLESAIASAPSVQPSPPAIRENAITFRTPTEQSA